VATSASTWPSCARRSDPDAPEPPQLDFGRATTDGVNTPEQLDVMMQLGVVPTPGQE
jgi:hypothetical protein